MPALSARSITADTSVNSPPLASTPAAASGSRSKALSRPLRAHRSSFSDTVLEFYAMSVGQTAYGAGPSVADLHQHRMIADRGGSRRSI